MAHDGRFGGRFFGGKGGRGYDYYNDGGYVFGGFGSRKGGNGGKGKGKGKDGGKKGSFGGKGKVSGTGKGKGDFSYPETYFYEVYPHKAKGLRVIKCPKSGCYGCCLEGDNPPKTCNRCGTAFNFGAKSRSASPAVSTKSDSQVQNTSNAAKAMYDALEADGIPHDRILEHLKMAGLKLETPKTPTAGKTLTTVATAIAKIESQIAGIENNIKGAWEKYTNLNDKMEETVLNIDKMTESKKDLYQQKQRLENESASISGHSKVATSLAAGISPNMEEAWCNLDGELEGLPEEKREAVLTKSMNFLQTTQLTIAEHQLKNEGYEKTITTCLSKIASLEEAMARLNSASKEPVTSMSKSPPNTGAGNATINQSAVAQPYLAALRSPPTKQAAPLLPKAPSVKSGASNLGTPASVASKPLNIASKQPAKASPVAISNIDEETGNGPLGLSNSIENDEDDLMGEVTTSQEDIDLQNAKKRCRTLREANPVATNNSFQMLQRSAASIASSVVSEAVEAVEDDTGKTS